MGDFFMKKGFLKGLVCFFLCSALFIGGSYAYLTNKTEKKTSKANEEKEGEPYADNTPKNCGIILSMPDNSGILFYLDFLRLDITVCSVDDVESADKEYNGYPIDYHIYADYNLISGLIDRIGGIKFEQNGEMLRLTGVQAVSLLGNTTERVEKYKILKAVFETISESGLDKSDFVYIIQNCDSTELSLADCFYWSNYIKEMGANISIIT